MSRLTRIAAASIALALVAAMGGALYAQCCGAPAVPTAAAADAAVSPQTKCPIMGGKIDKSLYADVNGHRIYVCCPGCLAKVTADPQAAIAKIRAAGEQPERLATAKPASCPKCAKGVPCTACKARKAAMTAAGGKCPKCAKGVPCAACKARKAAAALTGGATRVGCINAHGIAVMQRAGVPMMIFDARSGKYDDGRRIPGARSLNAAATDVAIAGMIPRKNALIVTYCANVKCPASHHLAERLTGLGYTNILELPEGIQGWADAGYPVAQADKAK